MAMKTDLVLSPFGANGPDMIEAASIADRGGFDTVWTYDHVSGLVADAPWSRDPFVVLGAVAAVTERINVGVLVANMGNRHPVQLACALNSLQSMTSQRVRCGIGSGASPGSRYAVEHEAVGRALAAAPERRIMLAETIAALRAVWSGEAFDGDHYRIAAAMAVTDGSPAPPVIVGATTTATISVACQHADGVNIQRRGNDERLADQVAFALRSPAVDGFEISVFDAFDPDHELGGECQWLESIGVGRRTLWVRPPYPIDALARVGRRLDRG